MPKPMPIQWASCTIGVVVIPVVASHCRRYLRPVLHQKYRCFTSRSVVLMQLQAFFAQAVLRPNQIPWEAADHPVHLEEQMTMIRAAQEAHVTDSLDYLWNYAEELGTAGAYAVPCQRYRFPF